MLSRARAQIRRAGVFIGCKRRQNFRTSLSRPLSIARALCHKPKLFSPTPSKRAENEKTDTERPDHRCIVGDRALAQDAEAGKATFNKCLACHSIGEDAKNKVGPELNGLDGRKSGTAPDYNYSEANKNSGITWNEANFKEYIKDPKAKVPGTKMFFAGIKNEKEVNDLWAYVSQFDDKDGKTK